jgi:tetratricopeptide (TPR) repeat protein
MQIALELAPQNRFILRSASRFLLHQGDGERAHELLEMAENLRGDPWLLSAEIATAAAIRKTSRWIKFARKVLANGDYSPHHTSELASALSTLEVHAGNQKLGKKLLAQSLRNPSENSIAQAAWIERKAGISVLGAGFGVDRSAEASTWYAFRNSRWLHSFEESKRWFADQPFSSRPAINGSYIASEILEDYELAIDFASTALLSSPNDVNLQNNLAFSLASSNRTDEAMKIIENINLSQLSKEQRLVVGATKGLIMFRLGHPHAGVHLYKTSINLYNKPDDMRVNAARIHLALEALRSDLEEAEELKREALNATRSAQENWIVFMAGRLEKSKTNR